jgi:hypothetical protein
MIVVKPVAEMRLVNGFYNLGVGVAEWIGCPAVLEIDVAPAVHVPDEIAKRFVDDKLPHGAKTATAGPFHFSIVFQAISKQWYATFEYGFGFWSRKLSCHALPALLDDIEFRHSGRMRASIKRETTW